MSFLPCLESRSFSRLDWSIDQPISLFSICNKEIYITPPPSSTRSGEGEEDRAAGDAARSTKDEGNKQETRQSGTARAVESEEFSV
mmetsp:Transcript_463/g.918  ORF Transcript_463/g.918 Transcript_463/m.918 type:complete len:86 (+) Transcript_463:37-294(+)